MNSDDQKIAILFSVVGIVVVIFIIVGLAIQAAICWFLSNCFKRIPPQFRKQEPGQVWLLMIPCFNLVWNFFVYPSLARSFQAYFRAQGRTDVGDCGDGLATAVCILNLTATIPYLNALTGPATLVVMIIFLVKANDLKNQIPIEAV